MVQIALKNPKGLARQNLDTNRRRLELSAASRCRIAEGDFERLDSFIFVPYMFCVRFLFSYRLQCE